MDRSVSGPLSISAAAAAVADGNEAEEELTNPISLADEDEEGLSESEVGLPFWLHPVGWHSFPLSVC